MIKFTASQLGYLCCAVALFLSACQSTSSPVKVDRDTYLQQFLGQSSQSIRSRLDLKVLGYQQLAAPVLSENKLSYVVQRPVAIPLPIAQFPVAGTGAVPIPLSASPTTGYDANLQCIITFYLENNIAQDLTYTGRTC